jgi:hypothetical protein
MVIKIIIMNNGRKLRNWLKSFSVVALQGHLLGLEQSMEELKYHVNDKYPYARIKDSVSREIKMVKFATARKIKTQIK